MEDPIVSRCVHQIIERSNKDQGVSIDNNHIVSISHEDFVPGKLAASMKFSAVKEKYDKLFKNYNQLVIEREKYLI